MKILLIFGIFIALIIIAAIVIAFAADAMAVAEDRQAQRIWAETQLTHARTDQDAQRAADHRRLLVTYATIVQTSGLGDLIVGAILGALAAPVAFRLAKGETSWS